MDASGGVLNFFRDGDPVEKCLRDENMRQWVSDATFCAKLREVQRKALAASTPQLVSELTRAIMVDPRLCQCLMSGSGVSVKVDDADLKKAERVGDIEKRSPMVLDDMVGANRAASAADAKAKGNEAYAKGQFALALAFWARSLRFNREAGVPDDADFAANIYSNIAQALLKLNHHARAEQAATRSLKYIEFRQDRLDERRAEARERALFGESSSSADADAADAPATLTALASARRKALHRRAIAREALRKYPEAQTDLQTALGGAAALPQAERASLERDAKRIAKLQSHATLSAAAKVERLGEERAVSKARVSGVPLEEKQQGPRSGPGASLGYIEEQDHSHWALQRLASLLEEVDVDLGGGASVAVDSALLRQCVVSASVTRKRGQRALYYEFDVHARWTAESPPDYDVSGSAAGADAPRPLKGVVRLYNVSHETKYEPGADTNVAYMYQLGYQGLPTAWFDGEVATASAPAWAAKLINGAHELYAAVSAKVDVLVKELHEK
mmetsp:Transcript_12930/g.44738  ORF Transcript_12930/g.44738 Transcript_12930/m.44738 type:complete len:504 (-) Transcript_12930:23-1534(-)